MTSFYQLKEDLQKDDTLLVGAIEATQPSKRDKIGKANHVRLVVALKGNTLKLIVYKMKSNSMKSQWDLGRYSTIGINVQPSKSHNIKGGVQESEDGGEFSLQLDNKTFQYRAANVKDKMYFIELLVKMTRTHTGTRVTLENARSFRDSNNGLEDEVDTSAAGDTYEELTAQEAADIENVIGTNVQAFRDGEGYSAALRKELETLGKASVVLLLQSEQAVGRIQGVFDEVLSSLDTVEGFLALYEDHLSVIRADVARLSKRDKLLTIQSTNYTRLNVELKNLLEVLDPEEINQKFQILDEGYSNLDDPKDRQLCVIAAKKLSDGYHLSEQTGVVDLEAVSYSLRMVKEKETGFVKRLERKLKEIIDQAGAQAAGKKPEGTLRSHADIHSKLLPFANLADWLRTSQFNSFRWLMMYYPEVMGKLYVKELDEFVEHALAAIGTHQKPSQDAKNQLSLDHIVVNSQSDAQAQATSTTFCKMLGSFVLDLITLFSEERQFVSEFFNENRKSQQVDELGDAIVDRNKFSRHHLLAMLDTLFQPLTNALGPLMAFACRLDRFNCVSLASLLDKATNANKEDTKTTLTTTLTSTQQDLRRRFETLVQEQIKEIDEVKVSNRFKMKTKKDSIDNITTIAANFPPFVKKVEEKMNIDGSKRRCGFVDRGICKYAQCLFPGIERLATECKSKDLVLFENCHYLYSELSMMKLPHLEKHRKEAQNKYRRHIALYVKENLGHPMEKLSRTMDGIKALLDGGTKDSEVCFQLQYSKQNLKKLVDMYPAKEVKKGLQNVYRKVEHEISTDSGQLQVVWRFMQDEFISQIQTYEGLIQRCYPDSGIQLDFTIDNLLSIFSEITQQH